MGFLMWCPECGYNYDLTALCEWSILVAAGKYPHRRPDRGDCRNRLEVINLHPKGDNREYRISR